MRNSTQPMNINEAIVLFIMIFPLNFRDLITYNGRAPTEIIRSRIREMMIKTLTVRNRDIN